MIDLVADPYGKATFRNGQWCSLWFSADYGGDGAVAYRVESGWWISYWPDGRCAETTSSYPTQCGERWDIVEWEPLELPENSRPEYWHSCCAGRGLEWDHLAK